MDSVARQNRDRALRAVALWCWSQAQGIELGQDTLGQLGFGSVKALQTQLDNWEVPSWITQEVEKPKPPKPEPTKREARSSGPAKKLPSASRAAPLFREKLEMLMRATEELGHRQEKRQAGRFFQNSVRAAPVFPRDVMSDEQWEYARETLGLDPEAKDYMYFGGATWSLGGGSAAPGAPLPALIGTYLLAGGDLEPLVEALHDDPASADWQKMRKYTEGRKRSDGLDGLQVLAQQLATLARGSEAGKGRTPAELSSAEYNLASRISELREQGWADEDIYRKLKTLNNSFAKELSWKDFRRLADLQTEFPWT